MKLKYIVFTGLLIAANVCLAKEATLIETNNPPGEAYYQCNHEGLENSVHAAVWENTCTPLEARTGKTSPVSSIGTTVGQCPGEVAFYRYDGKQITFKKCWSENSLKEKAYMKDENHLPTGKINEIDSSPFK